MATIVQYSRLGGPDVLEVVEVPTPEVSDGQVLVEVQAIGVNPIDSKLRSGKRPTPPIDAPRRVGSDASGVVLEVGSGVDGWAAGDEVIVQGATGAYASHLVLEPSTLVRKPSVWTWSQAAAVGIPVSTAYQALRSLGVGEGTRLLIHGGTGGVGQAAVQFAVAWGATVFATASPSNHARLAELGAVPLSYGDGLVERVREAAPDGIDVVLDGAGTDEALEGSLDLVTDRSRIGTIVAGARAAELGIRAWSGGARFRSPTRNCGCAPTEFPRRSSSLRRDGSRSRSRSGSRWLAPLPRSASAKKGTPGGRSSSFHDRSEFN